MATARRETGAADVPDARILQGRSFTLLLAALTALTALSIDMSLPAMPQLQRAFGADVGVVQLTLSLFLAGYAIGQLACGFLSDRFGRRPVLLAGLALFTAAGFACAFSPSLTVLIALRFVQGMGASVGPILARAMVRDRFGSSQDAVSILSQITQIMIVAPLLAPTLGAYLLTFSGWPAIFLVLGTCGALVGLICLRRLPETLPSRAGDRDPGTEHVPTATLREGIAAVFTHRASLRHAATVSLSSAGMFAYISGSPFVFMEVFGVERRSFGFVFALTAAALLVGATVNRRLVGRVPSRTLLRWGALLVAAAGVLIALLVGLNIGGLVGVIVPMMVYLFGMGLLQPNATALAMEPHARTAGAVSSVMGCAQTGGGALAGAAVGAFYNHTASSMAATVAVLAILTLVSTIGDASRKAETAVKEAK